MSERASSRAGAGSGAGAVAVSSVFAFVVAGVAGLVTTFTHAQLAPWGLVAGLAIAVAVVLGLRLVFASRVVGAAAGLGFVVGTALLAFPAAGTPMLTLNGPLGCIWAVGPAVLALVAVAVPWPEAPARRP
jgi:hypothetical protein